MGVAISAVIVTWNGEEVIEKCLRSIFSGEQPFSLEVIVVDNGSKDKTLELIRDDFPQVKLIENQKNEGFARANNQGIEAATGKDILLLNQDVELKPGTLINIWDVLEKERKNGVMAVAPKLVYPSGRLQRSLRPFPTPWNVWLNIFSLGWWYGHYYDYEKSGEVDQPMATCLLITAAVLKELRGFDDDKHFFLYFNDVDLSYRIHEAGYKHYFLHSSEVVHHHGQSSAKWLELKRNRAWCGGLYYFFSKHYAKGQVMLRFLFGLEAVLIFLVRILLIFPKILLGKK